MNLRQKHLQWGFVGLYVIETALLMFSEEQEGRFIEIISPSLEN